MTLTGRLNALPLDELAARRAALTEIFGGSIDP
jgi:hypothetical protein